MMADPTKDRAIQDQNGSSLIGYQRGGHPDAVDKKAPSYWISQLTWQLADRRAALHRAQKESAWEFRQAHRKFHRDLQVDIQ